MPEEEKKTEEPVLMTYGGKFHFEDLKIRKLRNGNMARVVIETPFVEGIMGELEKLFEKDFDVRFSEYVPAASTPKPSEGEEDQGEIPFGESEDEEPGQN